VQLGGRPSEDPFVTVTPTPFVNAGYPVAAVHTTGGDSPGRMAHGRRVAETPRQLRTRELPVVFCQHDVITLREDTGRTTQRFHGAAQATHSLALQCSWRLCSQIVVWNPLGVTPAPAAAGVRSAENPLVGGGAPTLPSKPSSATLASR
jgi:hypothetical protein